MPPPDDYSDDECDLIVIPEFRPPSESTVCRVCLATEGRMQRVAGGDYEEAYRQITGIEWDTADQLPQHVCWECAPRMRAAVRLRGRALAAHRLLQDLRRRQHSVTLRDIQLIDRTCYYLTSNLTLKHFPPNEYLSNNCNNNLIPKDTEENSDEKEKSNVTNLEMNADVTDKFEDPKNHEYDNKTNEKETNTDHAHNLNIASANKVEDERLLDYDSDDSSHCLVIDAEDPMETVDKSEDGSKGDGGMSIDELIDIYNNDGDGDGRLQELNEGFGEEANVQIDQGWSSKKLSSDIFNEDGPRPPDDIASENSKYVKTSMRKIFKEFQLSRAYEKLNRQLFTITPVSEQEQIAEIAKRQDTFRFKTAAFKCYMCFRSFQNRRGYDSHMRRHNAINGAYECSICKARQKSARAVKTHVYGQHTVRISCNECSFVTMNRSVARNHEKWHAGIVYQCPHCPGRFDQESTYKCHLRTQHVHAFACVLCGFTFVSAKGLAVHRCKRHPGADQIPLLGPYCETCDLMFAIDEAYSRHLKLSSRHRSNSFTPLTGVRAKM